jgi:hypothetical protein
MSDNRNTNQSDHLSNLKQKLDTLDKISVKMVNELNIKNTILESDIHNGKLSEIKK